MNKLTVLMLLGAVVCVRMQQLSDDLKLTEGMEEVNGDDDSGGAPRSFSGGSAGGNSRTFFGGAGYCFDNIKYSIKPNHNPKRCSASNWWISTRGDVCPAQSCFYRPYALRYNFYGKYYYLRVHPAYNQYVWAKKCKHHNPCRCGRRRCRCRYHRPSKFCKNQYGWVQAILKVRIKYRSFLAKGHVWAPNGCQCD